MMRVWGSAVAIQKALIEIHGEVCTMDIIELEGTPWLVPQWYELLPSERSRPERLVRTPLEPIEHPHAKYRVVSPIPVSVLFGSPTPEEATEFEIRWLPEVIFTNKR
ncbi:hypothetical protein GCM10028812_51790 [Ancylobacter sonchi]